MLKKWRKQHVSQSKFNYLLSSIIALCVFNTAYAGSRPLWTFTPLTETTVSVPSNDTAMVQYRVTNQSNRTRTLMMQPIQGITQLTSGLGICGNPFILTENASCTLSLQVNGSQLTHPISDGPIVCKQGSTFLCYRPSRADILDVTQAGTITDATMTVTGSPLTLATNGSTGTLTINNTSLTASATNIVSNFTDTALEGYVTETGNTCASVAPQASCTLTYTPGSTVVAQTDFTIQGSNTNAVTAAIDIESGSTLSSVSPTSGSASGGTGITLTGTSLTGATGVTFGGTSATSVHVVNSTTVTAVTPAHAAGAVDVVIATPNSSATLTNGYTYETTAVGQSAYGGKIACLHGGLNNLIAATADNSTGIEWGGNGTAIGADAQSDTDGATNTTAIVAALGDNGGTPYAAQLCANYEVDSQGNTPCESGNICYDDWFLPAGNNNTASGQLNCLYENQDAIGGFAGGDYWSSTEFAGNPSGRAWILNFDDGNQRDVAKFFGSRVRCVRAFTP